MAQIAQVLVRTDEVRSGARNLCKRPFVVRVSAQDQINSRDSLCHRNIGLTVLMSDEHNGGHLLFFAQYRHDLFGRRDRIEELGSCWQVGWFDEAYEVTS